MMAYLKHLLGVVVGLGLPASFLYIFSLGPLLRILRARTWPQAACTVVSSYVEQSTSDPGLYGIRITYQYEVAGCVYTSARYSFSDVSSRGGFSAGHRRKKAIVNRLQPGVRTLCYVDPEDPAEAVIYRGISWDIVVVGILMLILFTGIAFAVLHDNPPTAHRP